MTENGKLRDKTKKNKELVAMQLKQQLFYKLTETKLCNYCAYSYIHENYDSYVHAKY